MYTPSSYSSFTNCSFDLVGNKHDYYRGKNCMERICKNLKEHVTKVINYKRKK